MTEGRLTHVAGQAALDEEDVTVGVAAFGAQIERALATVWQGMLRPVHDLESGNQCQQPRIVVTDHEIRAALDQHWAASDADDFVGEHGIYRDDAVLDYPQSGERIRGRLRIQASRFAQPNQKHFEVRRIVGSGGLWVTEYVLTYDGRPSHTVSIMEFIDGKVAHETQYFGDPFDPGPSRAQWVERMA